MNGIYESWLKRTNHISEDCSYCNNQRYYFEATDDGESIIFACPSCNFDDLQITKKTSYLPLHKFIMVKNGELNINTLK